MVALNDVGVMGPLLGGQEMCFSIFDHLRYVCVWCVCVCVCAHVCVCVIGANHPELGGTLTIFDCLSRCPTLPSVCHEFLNWLEVVAQCTK